MIPFWLSPWFWLVIVVAGGGLYAKGHHDGDASGANRTMVAWDKANVVATEARQKRIEANADVLAQNAKKAQDERKRYAENTDRMRGNLLIALNGLRDRPTRAEYAALVAKAGTTGAGADQRCTGAGLYRDDAEFLTWRADAAQRIRLQRDACYRQYESARETVSKLSCQ
jgi:hypothetical protein